MSQENKNDEIIRQILDDNSLRSLNNLKHINKVKGYKLQEMLLSYFSSVNRKIYFEEYLQILDKMEEKSRNNEIRFKRKNNLFDLDEIE